MRSVERQVTKERTVFVLLDERQRVVGEVVGDVAFAAHGRAVMLEGRLEVFAPMTRSEAVVFVETARVRVIRPLAAVVPFGRIRSEERRVGKECRSRWT